METLYAPELRVKIARYANEHELKAVTKHFAVELGHEIRHSTIQEMQKQFNQELAKIVNPAKIFALPHCLRGHLLMLGKELDDMVRQHVLVIHSSGDIFNRRITLAKALGIRTRKLSLLVKNGGGVHLNKFWANSILRKMNFCKRQGSKAAKKLPDDFQMLKAKYLKRITAKVKQLTFLRSSLSTLMKPVCLLYQCHSGHLKK